MKTLLIVEDNPDFIEAAKRWIKEDDPPVEVRFATDVETALDVIPEADLALVDIYMPAPEHLQEELVRFLESGIGEIKPSHREWYKESLNAIRADIENEAPVGISLADKLNARNIPFCFMTSLNHHAGKVDALTWLMRDTEGLWPSMVSIQDGFKEESDHESASDFQKKDHPQFWREAFAVLFYDPHFITEFQSGNSERIRGALSKFEQLVKAKKVPIESYGGYQRLRWIKGNLGLDEKDLEEKPGLREHIEEIHNWLIENR